MNYNKKYMDMAFIEAKKAFNEGEVPIGAVIVKNDDILACCHNNKEKMNCSIYHAEVLAIKEASIKLNNWRLEECDIYITLEPCPMCASAIKQSRIRNVYSAANNIDKTNHELVDTVFMTDSTNFEVNHYRNLESEKSLELLNNFFSKRRKK